MDIPIFRDLEKAGSKVTPSHTNYVRESTEYPSLGTITGMMLNLTPAFADAYIYSDVRVTDVSSATLKFKIGNGNWQQLIDPVYPFEFSIHLSDPAQKLVFKWISQGVDGTLIEGKEMELTNN
jgi:hypothetical protein